MSRIVSCMSMLVAFMFGVVSLGAQTTVLIRTGQQARAVTGAQGTIYNYAEGYQERGSWDDGHSRWIVPDVGYLDLGRADLYREVFFGGGFSYSGSKFVFVNEYLLDKATGPHSGNALSLLDFYAGSYKFSPRISASSVVFPYLPLSRNARKQIVIENAKTEYDFGPAKLGAGYGAYRYCNLEWQHKPFITTTLKAGRAGDLEIWLQRLPHTVSQFQLRYARSW